MWIVFLQSPIYSSTTQFLAMTVWTHQPLYDFGECKTPCGRAGCITLYTGDGCFFCDMAWEILKEVVSDFSLPYDAIALVDTERVDPAIAGPLGLPTIQICGEVIVGIPDIDQIRGALMHAVLRTCFNE
jgi:glutaredoxin